MGFRTNVRLDDGAQPSFEEPSNRLFLWRDGNHHPRARTSSAHTGDELKARKYDWAKTAMRYWPKRVQAACKKNKSYAIAHGLV